MFWADEVAQKLKERKLPHEWVDDMKTPSGKIHVGALRGVVVHDLAYKALLDVGVKAKYTYVFEDHDPMDGLPVYLSAEKFGKYMGLPLFKVPSPVEGYENYARYYASDFQKVFNAIGCNPEIIWVTDLYRAGKMNGAIKTVLDSAQKIRDIYSQMYKKEISKSWYPFSVYCEQCGKVATTEVYDWDGKEVSYECKVDKVKWTKGCGYKGKTSPFSDTEHIAGKMPWKVEWPAKWMVIGVTVEGGGKDHMSAGGSYDLSSKIAREVLRYDPPFALPYEFFLVGGAKMSSSRGRGVSASDMLDMLPPVLLRFLMVRTNKNQAINFDPEGETIPKLFDEYQRAANAYFTKSDPVLARVFELSQIGEIQKPPVIRFSVLSQWVQMPNMEEEIKKQGLEEWAKYARIWVEKYAPESEKFLVQKEIPERANGLSDQQKAFLNKVAGELEKKWNAEEFQKQLYEWAKELELSSKEAFAALYLSLIGKDHGPKAGWLVLSLDKEFVKKRFTKDLDLERKTKSSNLQILNKTEIFSIDKELKQKFPSITVGVAIIRGVKIEKSNPELEKDKEKLLSSLENLTTEQLGQYPEIVSYRKLYREMGVDWHSRRPSPEALLRRVALKKGLYNVNTCVDAYNLIVMKNRISVGAFDEDQLEYPTILRLAQNGEEILLLGDSESTKYTEKEVAYFDEKGGINMDFNYRDAQRSAVALDTNNLYINVDGVYDITPQKVEEVLKETCDIIMKYCGGKLEVFGIETLLNL